MKWSRSLLAPQSGSVSASSPPLLLLLLLLSSVWMLTRARPWNGSLLTETGADQLNSTQLKFIRKTVARRLKDTHENSGDNDDRYEYGCKARHSFPLPRFPPLLSGAAFSTPAFSVAPWKISNIAVCDLELWPYCSKLTFVTLVDHSERLCQISWKSNL